MIAQSCLFFGCWNEPGHFLVGPGGSRTNLGNHVAYRLENRLDGGFAPRKGRSGKLCWKDMAPNTEDDRRLSWELRDSAEYPQGQFLRHKLDGYTLIQWWDRCQGDGRGACNSTVLLEGDHTSDEMLAALKMHFPHVLENLSKHGVSLVDVTPTGSESERAEGDGNGEA